MKKSLTDGGMTERGGGEQGARLEGGGAPSRLGGVSEAPPLPDTSETVTVVTNLQLLHTGNHGNSCQGSRGGMEQSEDRKWYF